MKAMPNLIIGSRGSKLALWQSNWIKQELERLHPGLVVEIEIIKTTGDKMQEVSLAGLAGAGKGVFTKEIEEALLNRSIDLAVHSLKDLPTVLPDGLHLAAITERVDVRDALICSAALHGTVKAIRDLPQGARVGTSSLRRRAQLLHQRPDLEVLELRGNVDTRLRKLDDGQYDAIILASAGLIRLGFADRISARIDPAEMLTAVSQGALGIESRVDDQRTNLLLESLNHWATRYATEAERAVLRELGGGCAVPIAALGVVREEQLRLEGLVADVEGKQLIRLHAEGSAHQAEAIGGQLADALVKAGARDLLQAQGRESAPMNVPPVRQTASARPIQSPAAASGKGNQVATAPRSVPEHPLAGRRVIVTRSPKQSSEMVRFLEKLGAEVIACPTIEIKPPASWEQMDSALAKLSWFDWLAFTSSNGVEYFLRRLDETGHGRAELMAHKVCAVGRKTAETLGAENILVDVMPERFTAEALVEDFIKRFGVSQRLRGSKMLLPASNITLDVIRPAMEKIGVYVEVVEAYQTVLPATTSGEVRTLIQESNADYIIFTSPSTVANLAAILETDHLTPQLANTRVACIGPVTAEAAELHGLGVHIQPKEHTAEAVVRALAMDSLQLRTAEAG
ncbi:MAG: hydroxymethylbilane synthase [Acidobacteria bacterium]|nr:hydroxymethylbilane synthase [Acidobacteriota bacterium]